MLRRLTLTEHGVIELLCGLALIGLPLVLGLGPVALMAGIGAGVLVAGLGLSDGLPISAHMAADAALAAGLLAAALIFTAAGEPIAATLLACAAAAELALTIATRWVRR
jgi:hypothetical protein